jgi:hypothetical protein
LNPSDTQAESGTAVGRAFELLGKLIWPVELSHGNTDRSGVGLGFGASGLVTSPVSEDPTSKDDECVLD